MEPSLEIIRDELLEAFALGERDFHGMDLHGVDLSGVDLSGIDLSGSILSGANFTGTRLSGANLSKSICDDASMGRVIMDRADISWARFKNADLVGANLEHVTARAANFTGTLFLRAQLNDSDFLGACFTGANFMAANLESSVFECCDFVQANLSNVNLAGANLSWANLSDARLNWASMQWARLEACDLEHANLTGACLRASNLSFSSLQGAKLTGVDLYFANLSGAFVSPDLTGIARISSCRISPQTYERSNWNRNDLLKWQNAGATIVDYDSFPKDIQKFIRNSRAGFSVLFKNRLSQNEQMAIEALIEHIFGKESSFRILSLNHENANAGTRVIFHSDDKTQSNAFISAVTRRAWNEDSGFSRPISVQHGAPVLTISEILDQLVNAILKMEALVPTAEDDEVRRLNAILESSTENEPISGQNDEMTQISWSSLRLTPVTSPN
ncbi:MAG: pentapeptide repeat-containing protein [Bradymonadales bacterium]